MDHHGQEVFPRLEKIARKLDLVEDVLVLDLDAGIALMAYLPLGHAQAGSLFSIEINDSAVIGQELELELAELEPLRELEGMSEIAGWMLLFLVFSELDPGFFIVVAVTQPGLARLPF